MSSLHFLTPWDDERRAARQELAEPLWAKLQQRLELERRLVVDGVPAAAAIDCTLRHWKALTRHLEDGAVPIGRVEMWRGGRRFRLSVSAGPFRLAVPEYLRRNSVSLTATSRLQ